MPESCPRCCGFRYEPEGAAPGWYERDWRLLLDPTVAWRPCPDCGDPLPGLARLHEALGGLLVRRLEAAGRDARDLGGWRIARLNEGRVLHRWRDLAVVSPGADGGGWLLISRHGVLRDLDRLTLAHHLHEGGAPDLP